MKVWLSISAKMVGGCSCCGYPELSITVWPTQEMALSKSKSDGMVVPSILNNLPTYAVDIPYPVGKVKYTEWYRTYNKFYHKVAKHIGQKLYPPEVMYPPKKSK